MFRQKYLSLFIIAMMFFVIASGGCGGSSSSNRHENDNSNPDDPTTEYDISVLLGEWEVSNSNGTATMRTLKEGDENFDLKINPEDSGHFEFSNIQLNENTAAIDIDGYTYWEYQSGSRVGKTHGMDYYLGKLRQFQHVSGNTWRCVNTDPYPEQTLNPEETITITIKSPTEVRVEEERIFETYNRGEKDGGMYRWTASFTLTKQTTTTEYDISILQGTWKASNGEGTASDGSLNFSMSISSGHSSTVSFSDVSVIGDNATLLPESQIYWDVSQSGTRILSDIHDDFGGERTLEFQRTGTNTWQMSRTRSSGHIEKTIITLTSLTTANVERDGYYDDDVYKNVHYHMSYIITKQDTL